VAVAYLLLLLAAAATAADAAAPRACSCSRGPEDCSVVVLQHTQPPLLAERASLSVFDKQRAVLCITCEGIGPKWCVSATTSIQEV
jgi:hypothetical protein